ncbi:MULTISPECIES: CoA-disulfide reductase [Bacillus]|uniref:CoA-disulfide reductase n=1 Tax=Bacillus TaxID=1386 RepID=UPI000BB71717|nr:MULTISPECIES: CoA-disulfide reductase [Bacillus]
MEHVVIIGGVAGGMSAASKLRRLNEDLKITVFEKDEHVSYGACGLPYYISGVTETHEELLARSVEDFEKRNIHVHLHTEVIEVNAEQKSVTVKNLKTIETENIQYDKLLIATGSKPVVPPFVPKDANNVFTLKTLRDGINMRKFFQQESIKKVLIIGVGYIGMELLETMVELKKDVIMVGLNNQVLGNFDSELANIIEKGVSDVASFALGEEVRELVCLENAVKKVITNKSEYEVDAVIVNIGNKPNTEFLKNTGIDMLDNGAIIVNKHQESSIKDIFAAGDCATSNHLILQKPVNIGLGTTANKHGRIAAYNINGMKTEFNGILGTNVLKILDWTAAMTGITEKVAKEENIDFGTITVETNGHASYYPNAEKIHVKLLWEKKTKRVIGAQLVGKDKGIAKRIDVLATAITCKLTTDEIGMLDLSYAPPYATVWDAVQVAANAAK